MMAQSVADILGQHVKLSVEGIDRMYLNVYVPRLQTERGVVWFFREHPGSCCHLPPWKAMWRSMRFLSCSSAKASARTP